MTFEFRQERERERLREWEGERKLENELDIFQLTK